MNNFKDIMINYFKKYDSLSNSFEQFSKMYIMTTENIYEFLSKYDLKDKKVLTVMGSGDHALNSQLLGAKSVTCFDINYLSQFMYDLKKNVILNYDFNTFLNFFDIDSKRYYKFYKKLDKDLIDSLSNKLNPETYEFFSYIYFHRYIFFDYIFRGFDNKLKDQQIMNGYLTEENYYKLADILNNANVNFIESNITTLDAKLNDKYDYILLSNISDYIHKLYNEYPLEYFYQLIMTLSNYLNPDGVIQVGYCYGFLNNKSNISLFHNDEEREKVFLPDLFDSTYVTSFDKKWTKDKIITYKKVK